MGKGNGEDLTADLSQAMAELNRLTPWRKFLGLTRLVEVDYLDRLQVVVTKDKAGKEITGTDFVAFVTPAALREIRNGWGGQISGGCHPSDQEIAAWLTWIVVDKGGDNGFS